MEPCTWCRKATRAYRWPAARRPAPPATTTRRRRCRRRCRCAVGHLFGGGPDWAMASCRAMWSRLPGPHERRILRSMCSLGSRAMLPATWERSPMSRRRVEGDAHSGARNDARTSGGYFAQTGTMPIPVTTTRFMFWLPDACEAGDGLGVRARSSEVVRAGEQLRAGASAAVHHPCIGDAQPALFITPHGVTVILRGLERRLTPQPRRRPRGCPAGKADQHCNIQQPPGMNGMRIVPEPPGRGRSA